MIKSYNVAKVHDNGVEIVQMYPPLTMRQAREVRATMQRTFKGFNFVVLNVNTYLNNGELL